VQLPPDETVVEMQRAVMAAYAAKGLTRYEVSNYARPGRRSRHNTLYWTGGRYLALGAGAVGFVDDPQGPLRYANHRSAERYFADVEAGRLPEASRELLTVKELFTEALAMGLRLAEGVDVAQVCRAFGEDEKARGTAVRQLVASGLAEEAGGRLRLTARGFDVHSAIAVRLM